MAHISSQGCFASFSFLLEGPSGTIGTAVHHFGGAAQVSEIYKLPVSGLEPGATYVVTGNLSSIGGGGSVHYPFSGPPHFRTLARLDVLLRGGGSVASSPPAIDCGAVCGVDLTIGAGLTLTATPAAGYRFGHWEGDACSGTTPTCAAWVSSWVRTTAVFDQASLVEITRSGSDGGFGNVTSSPAGIDCGAVCMATFDPGQIVTLTATPDAGARFVGWSGACAGTAPTCTFTAAAGIQAVTATFVKLATLTVRRTGRGRVRDEAGRIDCGTTCVATVDHGTTETLHATPARGFRFAGWGGACTGTTPTCSVVVTGEQVVRATFKAKKKKRRKPRP